STGRARRTAAAANGLRDHAYGRVSGRRDRRRAGNRHGSARAAGAAIAAQGDDAAIDGAGPAAPAYGLRDHAVRELPVSDDASRCADAGSGAITAVAAIAVAPDEAAGKVFTRTAAATNGLRQHADGEIAGRGNEAVCIGGDGRRCAILAL